MSLDIGLIENNEFVVDANITHNLSKMWHEAGIYDALYNSQGKHAKEVIDILQEGLNKMILNPQQFEQFNAPNGWGTYAQALPWLKELINNFKEYPDGIIEISK